MAYSVGPALGARQGPQTARPTHLPTKELSYYDEIIPSSSTHPDNPEFYYANKIIPLNSVNEVEWLNRNLPKEGRTGLSSYHVLRKNSAYSVYPRSAAAADVLTSKAPGSLYSYRKAEKASAKTAEKEAAKAAKKSLKKNTTKPAVTGGRKRRHTRKHVHKRTHRPRRYTKHRHSRRCKH
jgi:hypothetical protein